MTDRPEKLQDEIELIDMIRVLWKWKYLILVGTLILSVVAGILSLRMDKIYRIDMVILPGILRISEGGKNTYIDSPQNIKALIGAGTFNEKIINSLNSETENNVPKILSFGIRIPRQSNTLNISYETSNIGQGIKILDSLGNHLTNRFGILINYYRNEYQKEINITQAQIKTFKAEVISSRHKLKNIQKRIDELNSEINLINNNTLTLIEERDKLIAGNNNNNILSSMLYANTIQQNLMLSNTYKNEMNEYKTEKEDEKVRLESNQNKIKELEEEIESREFKKKHIQNVQILQPPTRSAFPIKPKTKVIVIVAAFVGLFVMVLLAFLIEYVSKHKSYSAQ